jgi:CheY-like chemotaxis protein
MQMMEQMNGLERVDGMTQKEEAGDMHGRSVIVQQASATEDDRAQSTAR